MINFSGFLCPLPYAPGSGKSLFSHSTLLCAFRSLIFVTPGNVPMGQWEWMGIKVGPLHPGAKRWHVPGAGKERRAKAIFSSVSQWTGCRWAVCALSEARHHTFLL